MSDTGLSTSGLARLHSVMSSHVDRGVVPGLIAVVARHGDAHVEVLGTKALGDAEPLGRDAIFRIASRGKPVTAAAAMIWSTRARCNSAAKGTPGGFGRDGGTGTTWRSDLSAELTGILLTQRAMTSPEPPQVFTDFWGCAYGSILD